jgi:hypothetical protein
VLAREVDEDDAVRELVLVGFAVVSTPDANSASVTHLVSLRSHHGPLRPRCSAPRYSSICPAVAGPSSVTAATTSSTSLALRLTISVPQRPWVYSRIRQRSSGQSSTAISAASCAQYSTSIRGARAEWLHAARSSRSRS